MMSSAYYVNNNDEIWSVDLMNPLVQVTVFVTYSRMRTILLPKILLFGSKPMNKFGRGESLKFLSLAFFTVFQSFKIDME